MRILHFGMAAVLGPMACLPAAAAGPGTEPCAVTLADLQRLAPALVHAWQEISMRDGKPLIVVLGNEEGALHLRFEKTDEGLWAEGRATVCRRGSALQAQLAAPRLGPAAPWLLRQGLRGSPEFTLLPQDGGALRISGTGWSGTFVPRP